MGAGDLRTAARRVGLHGAREPGDSLLLELVLGGESTTKTIRFGRQPLTARR